MQDYIIVSDDTTDLPEEYCREHDLRLMCLSCTLDGVTYDADNKLPVEDFYKKLRAGSMPTTSQVNPQEAKTNLLNFLQVCPKILYIAFSSGLSGTFASVCIAANEIMEEHPEYKIAVVDSLCASLGEGLLVHKALQLRENGMSFDDLIRWLEENKLHLVHNFTVDDLFHLHRGGRVSKATAIIGSMINIKPVLHVDNEGHLIAVGKVRSRKRSIIELVNRMEEQIGSWRDKNDIVFISHGDCLEDARFLQSLIEERFGYKSFLINYVGPVIGTHSGPGTLALFYMGDYR